MTGFWLLLGHLIGDYIVQNDWMAANKANAYPGPRPGSYHPHCFSDGAVGCEFVPCPDRTAGWLSASRSWRIGHAACTVHCLMYTLAVWSCSFWWMPWWGLVVCFAAHWPVDRLRLAGRWMRNVSGQAGFAAGPLAPWSVVVVDNVFHLIVLGLIAAAAGVAS